MVAMDAHGRPAVMPTFSPEGKNAQQLWEQGKEIKEAMLKRRGRPVS
jgi:hypothetical protein